MRASSSLHLCTLHARALDMGSRAWGEDMRGDDYRACRDSTFRRANLSNAVSAHPAGINSETWCVSGGDGSGTCPRIIRKYIIMPYVDMFKFRFYFFYILQL